MTTPACTLLTGAHLCSSVSVTPSAEFSRWCIAMGRVHAAPPACILSAPEVAAAMYTLRCTQKLLRRGLAESAGDALPPTGLLGDWYANLLFSRPRHLVLCVSERTLLPLLVPASDLKQLPSRLCAAMPAMLAAVGVDPSAIRAEARACDELRIGRTASKRTLGSLNELMFQLEVQLRLHPEITLQAHALRLAQTPLKAIEHASPDRATLALFRAAAVVEGVRARSAS